MIPTTCTPYSLNSGKIRGRIIPNPIVGVPEIDPARSGMIIRIAKRGTPRLVAVSKRETTELDDATINLKKNMETAAAAKSHLTPFLVISRAFLR
jgi:hypothetical protein